MKPAAMWAHRRLRGKCPRYRDVRDDRELLSEYGEIPAIIGVYDNPDGIQPERIVIAEDGLYAVRRENTIRVKYRDLDSVDPPHDTDEEGPGILSLLYRDGTTSTLVIGGRDGRFRDVYQVAHFLMRVIDSYRTHEA